MTIKPLITGGRIAACLAVVLASSAVHAATGYMAFLTTQTTVETGDAASYMRAGTDWDKSTLIAGVAVPTLLQKSKITTWRDSTALHLKFEIPDATTTSAGATLSCGDQVIVQIGEAGSASSVLQANKQFRFEVTIKDNVVSGSVVKRVPAPVGALMLWGFTGTATTVATPVVSAGGNKYSFTLDIPLSEIGSPAGDIGIAVAILNDLGHSHIEAGNPVNEASGTAFPVGMGLTPESDPGLLCGAQPSGHTTNGNWINPSTWGTGYTSLDTAPRDVTLSQLPGTWISEAIKISKCNVTDWSTIGSVTNANWTNQSTIPNWYLYNPGKPCRMGVWVNADVAAGAGAVARRFLVLWGRPGIAPQEWFFAGLTDPVAVTAPETQLSFIWNDVPAVSFTSHPCMRVYVLPETLTAAEVATLKGIDTDAERAAMESTYGVAGGTSKSAQMNFTNLGTGNCTDPVCGQLSFDMNRGTVTWPEIGFAGAALAADEVAPAGRGPGDGHQGGANLVRIEAQGFGVAAPTAGKTYVYVESIGGLGWAVPSDLNGAARLALDFEVTNPKVADTLFVGGKAIEIPAPPRRMLIAIVADALPGTRIPPVDTAPLGKIAQQPMQPGGQTKVELGVGATGDGHRIPWWVWLLVLIIIVLVVIFRRRRP